MVKTLIRIGALAVPWLLTVVVPIMLLPGYIVSSGGEIVFAHFVIFPVVLVPTAPIVLFRWCLADPDGSLMLEMGVFFAGVLGPLVAALLFARFWSRRWFWLVWVGYCLLLAFDALVAVVLLRVFA